MKRSSLYTKSGAVIVGLVALSAVAAPACIADPVTDVLDKKEIDDDPTDDPGSEPAPYAGGHDNTFSHGGSLGESGTKDPFEVLAQRQEEGEPEIRTRLHSCQKLQNTTLRNILVGFGVDLAATADPPSAGQLLNGGGGALGAANYDARMGEAIVWSAAGAAKTFDIFVQAAPEIIANLPNQARCQVDGVGPQMFDENNACVEDAVTCLIGRPATADHLALCSTLVQSGTTIDKGKHIAVATMLAGAQQCE